VRTGVTIVVVGAVAWTGTAAILLLLTILSVLRLTSVVVARQRVFLGDDRIGTRRSDTTFGREWFQDGLDGRSKAGRVGRSRFHRRGGRGSGARLFGSEKVHALATPTTHSRTRRRTVATVVVVFVVATAIVVAEVWNVPVRVFVRCVVPKLVVGCAFPVAVNVGSPVTVASIASANVDAVVVVVVEGRVGVLVQELGGLFGGRVQERCETTTRRGNNDRKHILLLLPLLLSYPRDWGESRSVGVRRGGGGLLLPYTCLVRVYGRTLASRSSSSRK
jgi:hypothetical protein